MLPILLVPALAAAVAAEPPGTTNAERGSQGVRFALVGSLKDGQRESRVYRVSLSLDRRNAGTLAVDCENAEIAGASFKPIVSLLESPPGAAIPSPSRPAPAGDGTAIARAADNRLCN